MEVRHSLSGVLWASSRIELRNGLSRRFVVGLGSAALSDGKTVGRSARLSSLTFARVCLPNLPVAALGLSVLVYLTPYVASHLRLGMTAVGLVWMTVRLIDIPVDPLLAVAMWLLPDVVAAGCAP